MFSYSKTCYSCDGVFSKDSNYCTSCEDPLVNLQPIASWCLCNVASLNVFKISSNGDLMLVGVNDSMPEWCSVEAYLDEDWREKSLDSELNLGILYRGSLFFLDECIRV